MPVSAWPAGRILPLKEVKLPEDIDGPRRSFHLDGSKRFKDSVRIERGRLIYNIEGMRKRSARNSRGLGERRRQPLFGKRASWKDDTERVSGKLRVRPKPLPYRGVSSRVIRGERS